MSQAEQLLVYIGLKVNHFLSAKPHLTVIWHYLIDESYEINVHWLAAASIGYVFQDKADIMLMTVALLCARSFRDLGFQLLSISERSCLSTSNFPVSPSFSSDKWGWWDEDPIEPLLGIQKGKAHLLWACSAGYRHVWLQRAAFHRWRSSRTWQCCPALCLAWVLSVPQKIHLDGAPGLATLCSLYKHKIFLWVF